MDSYQVLLQASGQAMELSAMDGQDDVALVGDVLLVGRDPNCDVQMASPTISRFHCCLSILGQELVVRDLGSTNGLAINGRPAASGRLRPGDVLSIAGLRYRFDPRPARRSPERLCQPVAPGPRPFAC